MAVLDLGSRKPNPGDDLDGEQISNGLTDIENAFNALQQAIDDLDIGTIPADILSLQNAVTTLQTQVSGLGAWTAVSGTWLLASSDSPVFVLTAPSSMATTLSPGDRLKITDTTDKYGIVHKVSGTAVTVLVANSASIVTHPSAVSYSYGDTPPGFPKDPTKWEVTLSDTSDRSQAPSGTTWYNLDSALYKDIPIGAWDLYYRCAAEIVDSGGQIGVFVTLAAASAVEDDEEMTSCLRVAGSPANAMMTLTAKKPVVLAAKTRYFLNIRSLSGGTTIGIRGSSAHATVIRARSAYL